MTAVQPLAADDAPAPLLTVSGLEVRFGAVRALDGVDLSVRPGELIALAGENGAGKTTLVRCIAGDIAPASGEIFLAGRKVLADPRAAARQGIGVVWQDLALCDNLDVAANILLGQEPRRLMLSGSRFHAAAAQVLESLRIPLRDTTRSIGTLSGGQRQLVAVARAMRSRPLLLALDEPTASLGVRESAQVEALIVGLREQGTTILLACHDIEQMFRLADRIVVLRQGRVVGDLDPRSTHPPDGVALLSGQQVDSSARRQLSRLHRLADRLASADRSSSLSLILSALGAALDTERLCIHLVSDQTLICAASLGFSPGQIAGWSALPFGPAGGPVGMAAATERPVAEPDVRASAARAGHADLAAGITSSWSVPVMGPGGLSGVITVFRTDTRPPQRDELDLVTLYAGYAASALEHDRLLDQVTARNRVLETIREVLETLAGPVPVADGLFAAVESLRRGLRADEVALLSQPPDAAPRWRCVHRAHGPGSRRPRRHAVAARHGGAVPGRGAPRRRGQAGSQQPRPAGARGRVPGAGRAHRAAGMLEGASRHQGRDRAHGGRRALAAARAGTRGGRPRAPGGRGAAPVAGTAARLPVPDEPRVAHPADGHPRLCLQPDAAGRDLGHRLAEALPRPDRRRVGPPRPAGGRPARLFRDRVGRHAAAARLVRPAAGPGGGHHACLPLRPTRRGGVHGQPKPGLPAVWADHDRMEQVFVNLLSNAVRHNPPGTQVRVTAITARATAPTAPAEIVISVIDDGTGMPGELAAAFDVTPQRRAPSAGAGLGLSIAKAIIEAHGGSIELRRPARGTCFRISLPVEASDRPGADDGHRDGLTGEALALARETEEAGQGLGRHD